MPGLILKAFWLSDEWPDGPLPRVGCGDFIDPVGRTTIALDPTGRTADVVLASDRICISITPLGRVRGTSLGQSRSRPLSAPSSRARTTGAASGRSGLLVVPTASRGHSSTEGRSRVRPTPTGYGARR